MKVIEWKPLNNFEGYFINELGEVKSTRSFKGTKEKILKGSYNQQGYKIYSFIKDGKVYTKTLHRLLMETFIPNSNNLPCINHIDGNILNNSLDNLEWCTYGHNEKEAYRLGLKQSRIKGKPLYQCDLNGNIIKKWNSINEVAKAMNYSSGTICSCCNKKRNKTYKGFIWRYVNE